MVNYLGGWVADYGHAHTHSIRDYQKDNKKYDKYSYPAQGSKSKNFYEDYGQNMRTLSDYNDFSKKKVNHDVNNFNRSINDTHGNDDNINSRPSSLSINTERLPLNEKPTSPLHVFSMQQLNSNPNSPVHISVNDMKSPSPGPSDKSRAAGTGTERDAVRSQSHTLEVSRKSVKSKGPTNDMHAIGNHMNMTTAAIDTSEITTSRIDPIIANYYDHNAPSSSSSSSPTSSSSSRLSLTKQAIHNDTTASAIPTNKPKTNYNTADSNNLAKDAAAILLGLEADPGTGSVRVRGGLSSHPFSDIENKNDVNKAKHKSPVNFAFDADILFYNNNATDGGGGEATMDSLNRSDISDKNIEYSNVIENDNESNEEIMRRNKLMNEATHNLDHIDTDESHSNGSSTFNENLISSNFDQTNNFVYDENEYLIEKGVSFSLNSDSTDSIADIDIATIINNARAMLRIVGKDGIQEEEDKLGVIYDENNIIRGYEVVNDGLVRSRTDANDKEYNVIKSDEAAIDDNKDDDSDKVLSISDDNIFHNAIDTIDDIAIKIKVDVSTVDTSHNSKNDNNNSSSHMNDNADIEKKIPWNDLNVNEENNNSKNSDRYNTYDHLNDFYPSPSHPMTPVQYPASPMYPPTPYPVTGNISKGKLCMHIGMK